MKLTTFLGALAGVAVLALPVSAHAADYERFSVSDPSNAEDAAEPATAGVDLVGVTGKRTDRTITVVQTLRNFRKVDASRRLVLLADPETRKGRLVEYRTTPAGKVQTAIYSVRTDQGSSTQYVPVTCRGLEVVPRSAQDQLVFSLPARCYPGRNEDGALVAGVAARWTEETWDPGPVDDDGNPPSESDSAGGAWYWSGDGPTRAGAGRLDLF